MRYTKLLAHERVMNIDLENWARPFESQAQMSKA